MDLEMGEIVDHVPHGLWLRRCIVFLIAAAFHLAIRFVVGVLETARQIVVVLWRSFTIRKRYHVIIVGAETGVFENP